MDVKKAEDLCLSEPMLHMNSIHLVYFFKRGIPDGKNAYQIIMWHDHVTI